MCQDITVYSCVLILQLDLLYFAIYKIWLCKFTQILYIILYIYFEIFMGSQYVYVKANRSRQLQVHQLLGRLDLNLAFLETIGLWYPCG
jgi:hypothetical protein